MVIMSAVMYLVKFGGSVITEKSNTDPVFKHALMDKLAESLKKAEKEYIIVHGAGSFGHILAKTYHLNDGFQQEEQRFGYAKTQTLVQQLNLFMLKAIQKQGIPAVSIPPHATIVLDNHHCPFFQKDIYERYHKRGFTPVTYGDVVLDHTLGFSICSGDLLMVALAEAFRFEKVIYVIDEDGLYWENPKKNPDAEFIEQIASQDLGSLNTSLDDHADVTGGMRGKIETISRISETDVDVLLLNGNKPGRLYDVLVGKETTATFVYR
jgi:isopentenyl phosphate kinase